MQRTLVYTADAGSLLLDRAECPFVFERPRISVHKSERQVAQTDQEMDGKAGHMDDKAGDGVAMVVSLHPPPSHSMCESCRDGISIRIVLNQCASPLPMPQECTCRPLPSSSPALFSHRS
jgi:hypothetical protein